MKKSEQTWFYLNTILLLVVYGSLCWWYHVVFFLEPSGTAREFMHGALGLLIQLLLLALLAAWGYRDKPKDAKDNVIQILGAIGSKALRTRIATAFLILPLIGVIPLCWYTGSITGKLDMLQPGGSLSTFPVEVRKWRGGANYNDVTSELRGGSFRISRREARHCSLQVRDNLGFYRVSIRLNDKFNMIDCVLGNATELSGNADFDLLNREIWAEVIDQGENRRLRKQVYPAMDKEWDFLEPFSREEFIRDLRVVADACNGQTDNGIMLGKQQLLGKSYNVTFDSAKREVTLTLPMTSNPRVTELTPNELQNLWSDVEDLFKNESMVSSALAEAVKNKHEEWSANWERLVGNNVEVQLALRREFLSPFEAHFSQHEEFQKSQIVRDFLSRIEDRYRIVFGDSPRVSVNAHKGFIALSQVFVRQIDCLTSDAAQELLRFVSCFLSAQTGEGFCNLYMNLAFEIVRVAPVADQYIEDSLRRCAATVKGFDAKGGVFGRPLLLALKKDRRVRKVSL